MNSASIATCFLLAFVIVIIGEVCFAVGQLNDVIADLPDGDEEIDATVEADDSTGGETLETILTETDADKIPDEDDDGSLHLKPSPDADTRILFLKPTAQNFPAGKSVRILVGLKNNGAKNFFVDSIDAAFRYPQDYSFYIQNFTAYYFHQTVEPKMDSSFEYSFVPSDSFSSRSFGLTINLNYRDADGIVFQDAVFNTTINVADPDDGFDGETFFLYVFLLAAIALLAVGAHQLFVVYGKKRLMPRSRARAAVVEMGTQRNNTDVDYDWLPKTLLMNLNKSPQSMKTKTSPRQRKIKKSAGTTF